jgi:hypothetical protein
VRKSAVLEEVEMSKFVATLAIVCVLLFAFVRTMMSTQWMAPEESPQELDCERKNARWRITRRQQNHAMRQRPTPSHCGRDAMLSREQAICYALKPPHGTPNASCASEYADENQQRAMDSELCVAPARPRKQRVPVYDVVLFGFEADTLEIRLLETAPFVTRTILIEAPFDHHGKPKPLVWRDLLRHTPRFRPFTTRVDSVVANATEETTAALARGVGPLAWDFEIAQERASQAAVASLPRDAIVVFGHIDELPSARAWRTIRACDGPMPTNVAIHNLHGHALRRRVRSSYLADEEPGTLGDPKVDVAARMHAEPSRGQYHPVWIRGGAHLSSYCYAGAAVLKEWTATEARPDVMESKRPSCASQVDGCRMAAFGGCTLTLAEAELPRALSCNKERYREWWHRDDPRLQTACPG